MWLQRGNRRVPTAGQRAHLHSASCPRLPSLATFLLYTWLPAPYFCTRGGVPSPKCPLLHYPSGLWKDGPHTPAGESGKTIESCVRRPLEACRCQTLKHSLRILLLSLIRLIFARTTGFWYHRNPPLLHRDVLGRNTDGCVGSSAGGGRGREGGAWRRVWCMVSVGQWAGGWSLLCYGVTGYGDPRPRPPGSGGHLPAPPALARRLHET